MQQTTKRSTVVVPSQFCIVPIVARITETVRRRGKDVMQCFIPIRPNSLLKSKQKSLGSIQCLVRVTCRGARWAVSSLKTKQKFQNARHVLYVRNKFIFPISSWRCKGVS